MKPRFSFKYGENEFLIENISSAGNTVFNVDERVTVTADVKEYAEFDAVEWVLHFENAGGENSAVFSDIFDCDILLPLEVSKPLQRGYTAKLGDTCVITMGGTREQALFYDRDKCGAAEFGFDYSYLDTKKRSVRRFANTRGRSSNGILPFFDITSKGSGYIAAVGWTGDWRAEFCVEDEGVRMRTGLKETSFYLEPQEKIRTTSVVIMKYTDGEDKHNKFRRLVKNHFSHKSFHPDCRDGLFAFALWGGISSPNMVKRLNKLKAHGIRYEDVWIDAGWYGNCEESGCTADEKWYHHVGEWDVSKTNHPDGLMDVKRAAAENDMRLMLWFEIERAFIGTAVPKEHPEWFLSAEGELSYIINLGNREAEQYVLNTLSQHIEKLDISCYRQDFNLPPTEFFRSGDGENRRGITEIKHITAMYRIWDTLLEKFPGLIIDNCASGGRRIDIETMRRSVPLYRTDYHSTFNENAEVIQCHTANISSYLPYTGCVTKRSGGIYDIRSTYSSSWGTLFYNAGLAEVSEADFELAKKVCDEYRRIRRYFSCDFYNHASRDFDDTSWAVWQYHDEQTDSGIVLAFRRSNSPFKSVTVELKGIDGNKRYPAENLDSGEIFDIDKSIDITLPEKRSCVIFEYKGK